MLDPADAHREESADLQIRCAVLTVSDSRTPATDVSGDLVVQQAEAAGFTITARTIVPDEAAEIDTRLRAWICDADVDAILVTGGTGVGRRDVTVDVAQALLTHELPGYGELFRMLSWKQVGSAALLSRAVGGLIAGDAKADSGTAAATTDTFLFVMPGSPKAVDLAMRELLVPELPHLIGQRRAAGR